MLKLCNLKMLPYFVKKNGVKVAFTTKKINKAMNRSTHTKCQKKV